MKKVTFNDFEVIYENGVAKISATYENSDSPFSEQEIKNFLAAILQNITNVGDGFGNPLSENVQIRGNKVIGQQNTL